MFGSKKMHGFLLGLVIAFTAASGQNSRDIDDLSMAWDSQYGAGSITSHNGIERLIKDHAENIIIVGYTVGAVGEEDYLIAKYSSSGEELWVVNHGGSDGLEDEAAAVAIDDDNNIYVTGRSRSNDNHFDFLTIKYNDAGIREWSARYDGSEGDIDQAIDIALDETGQIYVTGYVEGDDGSNDIATIKYNALGQLQWVQVYSGYGEDDEPVAVAVDGAGNILVAGTSEDSQRHDDFVLLKYNSDGDQIWTQRYNAPHDREDVLTMMQIDMDDHIILTGTIDTQENLDDYATVKYSPSGELEWVSTYNGDRNGNDRLKAMCLDNYGNIYVTGQSRNTSNQNDFLTIKYDPQGNQVWTDRYVGGENNQPRSVSIDESGALIVAGSSILGNSGYDYVSIKYSPFGGLVWTRFFDAGMSSDDVLLGVISLSDDAVVVSGISYRDDGIHDIQTVKYSTGGSELWSQRFSGQGNQYLFASDMVLDNAGNTYIAGYAQTFSQGDDFVVLKYNPFGELIWDRRYNGDENGNDQALKIKLGIQGDVIVTGVSADVVTTIKYNVDGQFLWVSKYLPDPASSSRPAGVQVDSNGNIYITGRVGPYLELDYLTLKYSPEGVEQWVKIYDGPSGFADEAHDIVLDAQENILVTGESPEEGQLQDMVTIKYNQDGDQVWLQRYNGSHDDRDRAYSIRVDGQDNVYVGGMSSYYSTSSDMVTLKYSSTGIFQRLYRYSGIGSSYDRFYDLDLDSIGNVYFTGTTAQSAGSSLWDIVTVKFNNQGDNLWTNTYNGSSNYYDCPRDLEVDSDGAVYVASMISTGFDMDDCYLLKYNTDGSEGGTQRWQAAGGYPNEDPQVMILDSLGRVYLAATVDWGNGNTINLVKYIPADEVDVDNFGIPQRIELIQNYPNPFNPSTTIRFSLDKAQSVNLQILDISGRQIQSLFDEGTAIGKNEITWNGRDYNGRPVSAGVYLCRLNAGVYSQTIKMLLLR